VREEDRQAENGNPSEGCRDVNPKAFPAIVLLRILILLFLPRSSVAGDERARRSDTLTLYLENDLFAFDHNDRYYTHGTKISWISRDLSNCRDIEAVPPWMHRCMRLPERQNGTKQAETNKERLESGGDI
jgi:hypothetical protein